MGRFDPPFGLPQPPDPQRGIGAMLDYARMQEYTKLQREMMEANQAIADQEQRLRMAELADRGFLFADRPPQALTDQAPYARVGESVPIRAGPPPLPGSFDVRGMRYLAPDENFVELVPPTEGQPGIYRDIRQRPEAVEERAYRRGVAREREEAEELVGLFGEAGLEHPGLAARALAGGWPAGAVDLFMREPPDVVAQRELEQFIAEQEAAWPFKLRELETGARLRPSGTAAAGGDATLQRQRIMATAEALGKLDDPNADLESYMTTPAQLDEDNRPLPRSPEEQQAARERARQDVFRRMGWRNQQEYEAALRGERYEPPPEAPANLSQMLDVARQTLESFGPPPRRR